MELAIKVIYSVISYGKCGMRFLKIYLQEEKSYRVSPHVASNFCEPTSHTTCRIQLFGSCVTGNIGSIQTGVTICETYHVIKWKPNQRAERQLTIAVSTLEYLNRFRSRPL